MCDVDWGKTSVVMHSIKLMDNTPFKEFYQHIPPIMYKEVQEHLEEMLKIYAIWLSYSLQASPIVLV